MLYTTCQNMLQTNKSSQFSKALMYSTYIVNGGHALLNFLL